MDIVLFTVHYYSNNDYFTFSIGLYYLDVNKIYYDFFLQRDYNNEYLPTKCATTSLYVRLNLQHTSF